MAGYGNAGLPPRMLAAAEETDAAFRPAPLAPSTWDAYAADRAHVAPTPAEEAAARLVRQRAAVAADAARRGVLGGDAAACEPVEGPSL